MLRRGILEHVVLLGTRLTFDFKGLLTQARFVKAAGRQLWRLVRPFNPDVLIAPGFGGAPLLYAVALAALEQDGADLAVWMVRDQRKTHYLKRWVEGPRLDNPRAVLLDDFLGKGSAIELMEQALAADHRQARICAAAMLFDQWQPLGSRQLSVSRFPIVSVFRRHDIGLTRDCHDAQVPHMCGSAPPFVSATPAWWRFEFNGATGHPFKSSPTVADDSVFAADDACRVWRFDGASGEATWCHSSLARHPKGIVQRLQWIDGSVVFGCYDGTVTRLNAVDGEVAWRWRADSHVHATPVVDLPNQRVFINTEQSNNGEPRGHLFALDWSTGRVLWRHRHGFWPPSTPTYSDVHGSVVAASNDRSLVCVDACTGEPRWQAQTAGLVRGQAAIAGDMVWVATENGIVQGFDVRSGAELHKRHYGPGLRHQFLHAADGVLYVLDDNCHLIALDAESLRIRWLGKLRSPGAWAPLPFGKYLLVLSREGHLAVFDPSREVKVWEGSVGGDYRQQPAVGQVGGQSVLACAGHTSGLKLFHIHPHYEEIKS